MYELHSLGNPICMVSH